MIKHPLYLVPFDFSEVSDSALRLAQDLAEANDGGVFLLHVVKKEKDKKDLRDKAKEKARIERDALKKTLVYRVKDWQAKLKSHQDRSREEADKCSNGEVKLPLHLRNSFAIQSTVGD